MFESKPSYEWPVPAAMREPGAMYWRMLSLTWTTPWFMMTIHWPKDELSQSFLIGNDLELVSALRSIRGKGTLESLACCVPARKVDKLVWSMHDLVEVWMGIEPGDTHPRPGCFDQAHRALGGPLFEPTPRFERSHFVARVGQTVCAPPA
jgi:hypothetical protein